MRLLLLETFPNNQQASKHCISSGDLSRHFNQWMCYLYIRITSDMGLCTIRLMPGPLHDMMIQEHKNSGEFRRIIARILEHKSSFISIGYCSCSIILP